jgi:hypothetical protein
MIPDPRPLAGYIRSLTPENEMPIDVVIASDYWIDMGPTSRKKIFISPDPRKS